MLQRLKTIALWVVKIAALAFVAGMLIVQAPSLRYGMGPKTPLLIDRPEQLDPAKITRATFVSVGGELDFSQGFTYTRYGIAYTYFNIKPYNERLVVRTTEKVTDEWKNIKRIVGKLRRFRDQPFSYHIRDIYYDKFKTRIPADAFFLAMDDVPRVSGWQIGAISFAAILWLVMFYFFFFFKRKPSKGGNGSEKK